jgi:PhzF family phenazine biosynthesis protein
VASAALHYAAFTSTPAGGNPAGVVLDATGMDEAGMLALAARLAYSESAFLWPRDQDGHYDVRYFSPEAEVPFCGHATIASGVALAEHTGATGTLVLHTAGGEVPVDTEADGDGRTVATLTSVAPYVEEPDPALVVGALEHLRWDPGALDAELPPLVAYAGARHLILPCRSRERLADLDYDFDALKRLMLEHDLITVDLIWREDPRTFHARNPFPVGGVVEDPATGAAAAAFGAYLRELGAVTPPVDLTIHQGQDMGRPSTLRVHVDTDERPEIRVSGTAVVIEQPA